MLKGGQELAYKDEKEAAELIFPFPSVSKCAHLISLQEEAEKLQMTLKVPVDVANVSHCN